MSGTTRVKLSFSTNEFEVEGSESAVTTFLDRFQDVLDDWRKDPKPMKKKEAQDRTSEPNPREEPVTDDALTNLPREFGAFWQSFPDKISGLDRALIAGYFAQFTSSEENPSFGTKDVSALLLQQNVRLANTTMAISRNVNAKHAFAVGRGRFRVSDRGIQHLRQLLQGGSSNGTE